MEKPPLKGGDTTRDEGDKANRTTASMPDTGVENKETSQAPAGRRSTARGTKGGAPSGSQPAQQQQQLQQQCTSAAARSNIRPEQLREHTTLMVHKPRNVLSATKDKSGRTNLSHLLRAAGFKCLTGHVGRLDFETSGLILVTTDGRLNSRLRRPETHCQKAYYALVAGRVSPQDDPRLASISDPLDGEKGGHAYRVSDRASARHLRTFQDRDLARLAGYASVDRWVSNPEHAQEVAALQQRQREADRAVWQRICAKRAAKAEKAVLESAAGSSNHSFSGSDSGASGAATGAAGRPRDGTLPQPHVDDEGWLSEIEVCVDQGRKHQVRRLIRRAKLKLRHLRRTRIGPLRLPDDLPCGGVRELRGEALKSLYTAVGIDPQLHEASGRATEAVLPEKTEKVGESKKSELRNAHLSAVRSVKLPRLEHGAARPIEDNT